MPDLLHDFQFAARVLLKNIGFTVVAVLALALGIGANTAIFSVVNSVLLKPLPYENPDKIVKIWMRFTGIGLPNDLNWVSLPEFVDVRDQNRSFSHIAAMQGANFNVSFADSPERIQGATVSPSLFPLLGVQAQVGRTFLPEESQKGRDNVVVISNGLWQRRFGSNPNVVGARLNINAQSYVVVGVLPPGFQYPDEAEMWAPLSFSQDDLSPNNRGSHGYEVIARIKPELTLAQVRSDMAALTSRIIEQNPGYPYRRANFAVVVNPLLEETVGNIKTALWILMGAVGFVLLIACANVANLLMVRASAREKEIAIRTALGAGRARLVRQLLTESVLLGIVGGVAGLLLARWGLKALIALSASSFPRVAGTTIDWEVLAFTMLISIATGVIFGIAPALQASRNATHDSLKEGGRTSMGGASSQLIRRTLVIAEIALSLVLLAGAGLLMKCFLRLQDVDPGFRSDGVLTMRVSLPPEKFKQPAQIGEFYRELLRRVRTLPGVQAAGAVSALPLSGNGSSGTTTVDTAAVPPENATPEADWRVAMPGYFEAMGIALVRGRYFDDRDTQTSQPVAIIDETMAQTYWPNEDPIGQRIRRGGRQSSRPWLSIVGVVRHVRYRTLEAQSRVQLYWPEVQSPTSDLSLAIRTAGDAMSLSTAVQKQVQAIDPDQPVYRIRTMREMMSESIARRRLAMLFLSIFAGAALALAVVGIYGITSYSVAQRSQEMGVRMALGASRSTILRLVLGQSLVLTAIGVVLGLAGSLVLTRLMSSLLFNVKSTDPATFVLVALVLAFAAMLAAYIPGWRATRVDPMVALRYE